MYSEVSYSVKLPCGHTDRIKSNKGSNLSPLFFNLYINDLQNIFGESCDLVMFLERTMTSLKSKLYERYTFYFKCVIIKETKVKGRHITKLRTYKLFKNHLRKKIT